MVIIPIGPTVRSYCSFSLYMQATGGGPVLAELNIQKVGSVQKPEQLRTVSMKRAIDKFSLLIQFGSVVGIVDGFVGPALLAWF